MEADLEGEATQRRLVELVEQVGGADEQTAEALHALQHLVDLADLVAAFGESPVCAGSCRPRRAAAPPVRSRPRQTCAPCSARSRRHTCWRCRSPGAPSAGAAASARCARPARSCRCRAVRGSTACRGRRGAAPRSPSAARNAIRYSAGRARSASPRGAGRLRRPWCRAPVGMAELALDQRLDARRPRIGAGAASRTAPRCGSAPASAPCVRPAWRRTRC